MDCRTSAWLVFGFSLTCCGCVLTQGTQSSAPAIKPAGKPTEEMPTVAAKGDRSKAGLRMALALAEMKAAEAQHAKDNPEIQMRLREDARRSYQEALKI